MLCLKSISHYSAMQTQKRKIVTAGDGSTPKFDGTMVLKANQLHAKLYLQSRMVSG